jgi:hypothetical protein
MLTRTKWWRGLGVAVIASVALSACEDTVVNVPPQPEPPAAPITITITPAQLNLTTGQTQQVVATVTGGAEGTSRAVTYSSSNTAVATVAATGVVTAVGPGAASIVATAAADATVRAAAGVTVTAAVVPPTPTTKVTIQSITEGVTLIPVNPDDVRRADQRQPERRARQCNAAARSAERPGDPRLHAELRHVGQRAGSADGRGPHDLGADADHYVQPEHGPLQRRHEHADGDRGVPERQLRDSR